MNDEAKKQAEINVLEVLKPVFAEVPVLNRSTRRKRVIIRDVIRAVLQANIEQSPVVKRGRTLTDEEIETMRKSASVEPQISPRSMELPPKNGAF